METKGGRIEGAVQRLLEGQKSVLETPVGKLFSELSVGSHPQDEVQPDKPFVPSQELLDDLEALTLEAGPTLEILMEQAEGSKINGAVLEVPTVAQLRMEAINWMSEKFGAFGFRDEWLADAILYMDRLAVQMHKSANFLPLGLERDSHAAEIQAAEEAMKSQDLWLASVMIALKMSEAESELDSSIQDLVVPLVPFKETGPKCTRERWREIKLTEFFVVRELDSRLMVPTALHFVQHLSREVLRAAAQADWQGLEIVELPKLIGPPLPGKEQEEQRQKNAMQRRLTKMQALAQCLADMAVAHKPSKVYGDKLSPAVLAATVLRLAIYGWGTPPQGCEECLDELQEAVGANSVPEEERRRLLADVYRLWQRLGGWWMSPVVERWKRRGLKLPAAPGREALSPLLQECCCFLTPLKKKPEPKDLSATPGSRPVQDLAIDMVEKLSGACQGPEVRELFPEAPAVAPLEAFCPAAEDGPVPMDADLPPADSPGTVHVTHGSFVDPTAPTAAVEDLEEAEGGDQMDVDEIADDPLPPALPVTEDAFQAEPLHKENPQEVPNPLEPPKPPEPLPSVRDAAGNPQEVAAAPAPAPVPVLVASASATATTPVPTPAAPAMEVAAAPVSAPAPVLAASASATATTPVTAPALPAMGLFATTRPPSGNPVRRYYGLAPAGALPATRAAAPKLPAKQDPGKVKDHLADLERMRDEVKEPKTRQQPAVAVASAGKQAHEGNAEGGAAEGGQPRRPAVLPQEIMREPAEVFPSNSLSRSMPKAKGRPGGTAAPRSRSPSELSSFSGRSHSSDSTWAPGRKKRKGKRQAKPRSKKLKTQVSKQVSQDMPQQPARLQPFYDGNRLAVNNLQPGAKTFSPSSQEPQACPAPAAETRPARRGGAPRSRRPSDFARSLSESQEVHRREADPRDVFERVLRNTNSANMKDVQDALSRLEGHPSFCEDDRKRADQRIQEITDHIEQEIERLSKPGVGLAEGANLINQVRKVKGQDRRSLERNLKFLGQQAQTVRQAQTVN